MFIKMTKKKDRFNLSPKLSFFEISTKFLMTLL